MRWIPGGTFQMGSALAAYPEEGPQHSVSVDGFWMDEHPVTVAEFRRFVAATGYRTIAEQPPALSDYPNADPALLTAGSLVFWPSPGPVPLDDIRRWWRYVPGACWSHPEGGQSTAGDRDSHPVVHVCWDDVVEFAAWAGKSIPTEAEWELAARGGLDEALFTWGNEARPEGRTMANTWEGQFPWRSLKPAGQRRTSPVGSYPPNGFGLFDMAGNVWEWTSDYYLSRHAAGSPGRCCSPVNPAVLLPDGSYQETEISGSHIPRRVIKGGSHLCSETYCLRYRPAARQPQMVESAMSHLGFRCLKRP